MSYTHEIQVCKHLVENVANQMFSTDARIYAFFEGFGAADLSVNIFDKNFIVQRSKIPTQSHFLPGLLY